MQREAIHARIVMSPEELAALRLDVHLRRRSLSVNMIIYGTRHGPRFIELVSAMRLRPRERAAVADIVTAPGKGERWTDATTRRLGAALAAIRRRAHLVDADADPDDKTGIAWHLVRLDELAQQFQALRQREDMLAPATARRRRKRRDQRSLPWRRAVVRTMGRSPAA